jgi:hypothetical protein
LEEVIDLVSPGPHVVHQFSDLVVEQRRQRKPKKRIRSEGSDNRLVIRGAGERIVLHTPLFRGRGEEVSLALASARPGAVRRTVEKVRAEGHVTLGSLKLDREGLSLGRRSRIGFKDIRAVSVEFGKVKLEAADRVVRIPIAQVPNAVYLPAILGELTGR